MDMTERLNRTDVQSVIREQAEVFGEGGRNNSWIADNDGSAGHFSWRSCSEATLCQVERMVRERQGRSAGISQKTRYLFY